MRQPAIKIAEDAPELQIVWGEVYAPDLPDTDGDYMTKEAIREMAYKFIKSNRLKSVDIQHNNKLVKGAHIVESFIARDGDPDFIAGAWVVGVHIPDKDTWGRIKKGEINGFSMEAMVMRSPNIVELDLPPIIRGHTTKGDDDHEHEYYVNFSDKGEFLGGRTSTAADGHFHEVKRGTVTEYAGEPKHRHRYSSIDNLKIEPEAAAA